jgi:N-acetylglutamate synthase-like GNAT family acetyltransferase
MAGLIATGQIAVARAGERIVGAVRVQRLDTGEGELGMLVADPAHRGTGVGRELIRFAERWSRERGLGTMQLEVLVPRQWSHPSKEFLKAWYTRLGYRPVRTGQARRATRNSRHSSRHPATSSSTTRAWAGRAGDRREGNNHRRGHGRPDDRALAAPSGCHSLSCAGDYPVFPEPALQSRAAARVGTPSFARMAET